MSITIKHIEGNLAEGQPKEQTFGDSVDTITFGRERDCQVVYAPEYTVVGKRHCQLVRQVTGDYRVNLLGQRYVEINGVPADNNTVVPDGAVVRLGDPKDGPSFKVEIAKQAADLPDTRPAAEGQIVARLDDRDEAARCHRDELTGAAARRLDHLFHAAHDEPRGPDRCR